MRGGQAKTELPQGGGEMGERIRAFEWTSHPLGPPEHWPTALHVALGICLNSSFPTAIYWGRELYLLYNDAWAHIPGERHPWALGQSGADVWTDIWGVVGPQFGDVLEKGVGVSSFEQMLPMHRGGVVQETYWNYSLTPIPGDDGKVAGVFNQGHEITQAVQARRMREQETERLREVFAQAPGAVAVLRGPDHVFEIANRAYIDLIGGREDVIGKPVIEALPEVVEQGFVELLSQVYESGEPFVGNDVPIELFRDGRRQTRIVDFIYHPTRDLNGQVDAIFVQATDVTERKEFFDQLQALNATLEQRVHQEVADRLRAEDALRQAQKMESIGQLTGGIAHDFNNMLAVIIGALNMMQRRLAKGDLDVARYIEAATDGATRAASLTQRLLAFSRQQALDPAPLNANDMMAGMNELLGRTLGEHIQITTILADDLWRTFADRVQLESAVLNLAVNARDAMAGGGKLTIETANESVDALYAAQNDIPEGDYIVIAVTDTGSGMSAEVMEQAFEPFFTTKAVGKGTGLGLSQVFGFVRQSGGQVKLYSELGVGTTVRIYLPRYEGPSLQPPRASRTPEIALGKKHEVILVVEDDPRVRNFSTEALRELGYSVMHAAGGAEALALIERGQHVDLLFSDIVMPEMNGPELAAAAKKRLPSLRVLFTTGYARGSVAPADQNAPYLPKPFTLDQLAAKVRAALDAAEA